LRFILDIAGGNILIIIPEIVTFGLIITILLEDGLSENDFLMYKIGTGKESLRS